MIDALSISDIFIQGLLNTLDIVFLGPPKNIHFSNETKLLSSEMNLRKTVIMSIPPLLGGQSLIVSIIYSAKRRNLLIYVGDHMALSQGLHPSPSAFIDLGSESARGVRKCAITCR